MKKILVTIFIFVLCISVFAQTYEEYLAKAKMYESQKRWCYALGAYYDALTTNIDTDKKTEAFNGYNALFDAIHSGKPGFGKFNVFTLHDEWKNLLIDAEKYVSSFNPYEVKIGRLSRGDLDYETRTASYSATISFEFGDRYHNTIEVIEYGYKKARRSDWKDLPNEWPKYSASYKNDGVYNVDGAYVFALPKYDKSGKETHVEYYNAFYAKLIDCKFNVITKNGKELIKPKRCLLSREKIIEFKGISPDIMDVIENGSCIVNPLDCFLQYGKYNKIDDKGGRTFIKNFPEVQLSRKKSIFLQDHETDKIADMFRRTVLESIETIELNTLDVWSFTDELAQMVEYYKGDRPGVEIDYSLTPTDQFPNKLDPVLASGTGAPDVFTLEDSFVRKYIESGLLLDLTDVYNEVKNKVMAYPVEVGTYNGKVYGMSWQATPCAYFYRRSLAKTYLGTDEPAEVQKYFKDWNTFMTTAEMLKTKSNGDCYIISGTGDLFKPFSAARKDPWVVNGKLTIDPKMIEYMEMSKIFRDKGYEGRIGQWSEGWFAGMKGDLRDKQGNPKEVFGYFLSTWGLHYILKPSAPDTSGDWGMVEGPVSWRWGGTWVAAYKGTKVPDLAKDFIKYVTTDDSFLERWAKDTGDVVSNLNVVNKIKDTYSDPYLNGQNHYAMFTELAKNVNGKLTQGIDQVIDSMFSEATAAYVLGKKSLDQALYGFKAQVAAELGL